ncbi:hypothetical protein HY345_03260 [Candidatus Microgenomates bacterium]|nr:hypothetical protein [Candidatus Microgenomates bacterium]
MRSKDLAVLGVLTLMTVVFWMITEVLHTSQKSTISPVLQQQIKPIVPTFDTQVIKILKDRQAP